MIRQSLKHLIGRAFGKSAHSKKRRKPNYTALLILLVLVSWLFLSSSVFRGNKADADEIDLSSAQASMVTMLETTSPTPAPTPDAPKDEYKAEAEAMAKVAYGMARHHSEENQIALYWGIINRVESTMYPNTIEEVCSQPSQWVGQSDESPVLVNLYELALGVIEEWKDNGHRPFGPEFLYITWSSDSLVFRDQFTEGKNTHYWEAD